MEYRPKLVRKAPYVKQEPESKQERQIREKRRREQIRRRARSQAQALAEAQAKAELEDPSARPIRKMSGDADEGEPVPLDWPCVRCRRPIAVASSTDSEICIWCAEGRSRAGTQKLHGVIIETKAPENQKMKLIP